jgi:hypothetical protein
MNVYKSTAKALDVPYFSGSPSHICGELRPNCVDSDI